MKNLSVEEKNDLESCVFIPLKESKKNKIVVLINKILIKIKEFIALKYKN